MSEVKQIFIQGKNTINITEANILYVKDLAHIVAEKEIKEKIDNIKIIDITNIKNEHIVISIMLIIKKIKEHYPNYNINIIGDSKILVRIRTNNKSGNKLLELIKVSLVCSILFLGAALAINHFHADVNMKEAHSNIYRLITGEKVERPLALQIAYSIGIGIGMTLFFFRIPKQSPKDEPSPLDLELYLYNQNIDEYILDKEKQKS